MQVYNVKMKNLMKNLICIIKIVLVWFSYLCNVELVLRSHLTPVVFMVSNVHSFSQL